MSVDQYRAFVDAARVTDAAARLVAAQACEGVGVAEDAAELYRLALTAEQAARTAWLEST